MTVEIGFYHCTRTPAREAAIRLATRSYEAGQRLLIVAPEDQIDLIDRLLWSHDEASFLPHGQAGTTDDPEQPILISSQFEPVNGASWLLLLDRPLPADFDRFRRVFRLFDEGSTDHESARRDWRACGGRDGVQRSYWQQKERGWERKD